MTSARILGSRGPAALAVSGIITAMSLMLVPGLKVQGDPGSLIGTAPAVREELTPETFKKLHAMIKPHAGEAPWEEIPWIADLYEARQKAATEGKPLFVWSANCDPLGCT
jgi:hypothetical protein